MLRRLARAMIGPDWVLAGMALALSTIAVAFWDRLERPWLYLCLQAGALALVALPAWAAAVTGRPLWVLVRHWYPVLLVPAVFYELAFLIPQIHPGRHDALLAAWDRDLFGDVKGAIEPLLTPPFVDVLSVCYLSYFVSAPLLMVVLWRRADPLAFREAMTVCLLGWYLSYLGYFLVPSTGPYALAEDLVPRAALMQGCHARLLEWEMGVPTAFPSGHVLVTLLVLYLAWRRARRLFWILLAPSLGLIVATIGLRYHYVVDVVAGAAMAPPVVWAGLRLHRAATP